MSEFFSQLGANIRFPDANINGGGPLPTSLSGPAGVNGDPDGRINFNSELLSGIAPYAYGPGQGRMGADRNYQQIPHRIQKIVPKIYLPYADVSNMESNLALSHAVDQGDIAFILQSTRVQSLIYDNMAMRDASIANLQIPSHTVFINISTVNYLLAGLQRLTADTPISAPWAMLSRDLGYQYKRKHQRLDILRLVSTRMIPFGICAGSEHQGGKHETGLAPVQAAANHVTTLTIDGQNRDLVNIWRNIDISAGDNLILKLQWLPTQNYTLNHYYKGVVRQTFVKTQHCWQLIPDVFKMGQAPAPPSAAPWSYDYRVNGFWRIGQCFQHRASCESDPGNVCDDTRFLRGQLLQVTFAPVWTQFQPLNQVDADDKNEAVLLVPIASKPFKTPVLAKRTFQDAFEDPDTNCLLQHMPASNPVCLLKKWNLATSNAFTVDTALLREPVQLTNLQGIHLTESAAASTALAASSATSTHGASRPSVALSNAGKNVVAPAIATAVPTPIAPAKIAPAKSPVVQPIAPTGDLPRQLPASADLKTGARQPTTVPAIKKLEPSVPSVAVVSTRPVASLDSLASDMSQLPTDSTTAPAVAGERTVKRVLNKGSKRQNASP
jgi:hypothetical protein